jgi:hypothetical protein
MRYLIYITCTGLIYVLGGCYSNPSPTKISDRGVTVPQTMSEIVDKLLEHGFTKDSIDYRSYYKKDREQFLNLLIDKIDVDRKIPLYVEDQSKFNSVAQYKYAFIGVKALCFLNMLINDSSVFDNQWDISFNWNCSLYEEKADSTPIALEDLRKIKSIYRHWLFKVYGSRFTDQKKNWDKEYAHQLNEVLEGR